MIKDDWTLTNLPPEGDPDVAEFFHSLYKAALAEQERMKVRRRLLDNHAMYRGKFKGVGTTKKIFTPINLFFANVERTVANITSNNPVAEVVDMDGIKDGAEDIVSSRLVQFWGETAQKSKLKDTAKNMEIYGYTVEKPWWDRDRQTPDISVRDPFGVIPAPGVWRNWSEDPPFVVFLNVDTVGNIEKLYEVEGVAADETYSLLGGTREQHRLHANANSRTSGTTTTGKYSVPMSKVEGGAVSGKPFEQGLIIEIWIRGATGKTKESHPMVDPDENPILDPITGDPVYEEITKDKYPDGIRKVTITKRNMTTSKDKGLSAYLVLDDSPNPLINPMLPIELAKNTHPWGRIPCYNADSYTDSTSSYGFSAGEQTGDLLVKISNIFTRLFAYVEQSLAPMLVVERFCGITNEQIAQQMGKPRLVLRPSKPQADIRYIMTPNLPATFFNVLNVILQFYDRVYQIEDADRGVKPSGVVAASAIVALQERNAMLLNNKSESIKHLASERGMWAIGLWQNFGTKEEKIDVNDNAEIFQGVMFSGRRFSYQVEAGSTLPRTELQVQEQVKWLASMKLVDLRTILETLNFPNWKNVVERSGESQLDVALNVLIQAGLDKEIAMQLKQELMLPQGGPGDVSKGGGGASDKKVAQGESQRQVEGGE